MPIVTSNLSGVAELSHLFRLMQRTCVFIGLRVSLLEVNQFATDSRSAFMFVLSNEVDLAEYVRQVSSAKSLTEAEEDEIMSLIYKRKNVGPHTVPWGIPQVTGAVPEVAPLSLTYWWRSDR